MSSKLSMMVPDEPTKDPKISSGSSLPLPESEPKVKSVKKPLKAQDKNTPSSSIVINYQKFKKFDIVDDYSDHKLSVGKQPLQVSVILINI